MATIWKHGEMIDANQRLAALEAELAKRRKEAQEYEGIIGALREELAECKASLEREQEFSRQQIAQAAVDRAELAECRREKTELAERYVGDLGQEVVRLGRELDECRAKLAKHPPK